MELALFILCAVVMAASGFIRKDALFEWPTVAGLLCLAFFVPQALYVDRSPVAESHASWMTWLYMTLCLCVGWIGFQLGKTWSVNAGIRHLSQPVHDRWLSLICFLLLVFGVIAVGTVLKQANHLGSGTEWRGVITLWYLLIQLVFFSAAISWVRYLQTGRIIYLLIALTAAGAILFIFNQNVKRHMIAELAIIAAGGWFFCRGQQPWRGAVLAACLFGTVFLHQVAAVRAYVHAGEGTVYDAVVAGVPFHDFRFFEADRAPEVTHAVIDIADTVRSGEIVGPAILWNTLVHQYVPAFLVGRETKDGLKSSVEPLSNPVERRAHDWYGATRTGFSDTFRALGPVGALMFLALGAFMGTLYGLALTGHFTAQVLYLVLLNDSLVALTESTARFVTMLPFVIGIVWLATRAKREIDLPGRATRQPGGAA